MDGTITNSCGVELHFSVATMLMDDDLREELHRNAIPCTYPEFFDKYTKAHGEKFGKPWVCDDFNGEI